MAIVRVRLKEAPKLTDEQRARLRALEDFDDPMDDPDCPPDTEEDSRRMRFLMQKYKTRRLTKEMYIAEGFIKPKEK
ncbi:MAG: hypothetical protein IJ575_09690 [Selenomonadaceae bacterium]|nr:hypothetical protein [Selenomonadaceae bacterium]